MKKIVCVVIALSFALGSAHAAIDGTNPDWLIYRDPFGTGAAGDASYFDQYAEVYPGDTLTSAACIAFISGRFLHSRFPMLQFGYLLLRQLLFRSLLLLLLMQELHCQLSG